ncbi:Wall-associated receptor kinase 2 [Bienertia sinuspersici]
MKELRRVLCVLMMSIITNTILTTSATEMGNEIPLSKPGCPSRCGNVSVPYPFDYNLNCSHTTITNNPPRLFFSTIPTILEVMDISIKGKLRLKTPLAYNHYQQGKLISHEYSDAFPYDLFPHPQVFSDTANKLTVVGCDDSASASASSDASYSTYSRHGCHAYCSNLHELINGSCSGNGCCQVSIPNGMTIFNPRLDSDYNHSLYNTSNTYGYAFIAEEGTYTFNSIDLFNHTAFVNKIHNHVRVVTEWFVRQHESCNKVLTNKSTYVCQNNTHCIDFQAGLFTGYRCSCLPGYRGNPYLSPGCTDIDECAGVDNPCSHTCTNIPGSYKCSCPKRHKGNGLKNGTGCTSDSSQVFSRLALGFGASFGSIIVLLVGSWLY